MRSALLLYLSAMELRIALTAGLSANDPTSPNGSVGLFYEETGIEPMQVTGTGSRVNNGLDHRG